MREIFNSHPVMVLKKEISKTNIKGYSKMKKAEIVDLMMKNKERFSYIKMAEKKAPVKKAPPAQKKKQKFKVIRPKSAPKKVEIKKEKIDFKLVMKGVDKKLNNIYPDVIENAGSIRKADSLIKKLVKNILKENKFNNNDEAIRFINKISNDKLFSMVE